jgi:hypothetical protein
LARITRKLHGLGRGWTSDGVQGGIAAHFECGIGAFRQLSARSYQRRRRRVVATSLGYHTYSIRAVNPRDPRQEIQFAVCVIGGKKFSSRFA